MTERCRRCKFPLIYEDELDYGLCEGCLDEAYERSQEAREWAYYHPGDEE